MDNNQSRIEITLLDHTGLVCLKETSKIEPGHPLEHLYRGGENLSNVNKAQVSVLNSILFQRRYFFVISRRSLIDLVLSDQNWSKPNGFKSTSYGVLLKSLFVNHIAEVKRGEGREPSVYVLTCPKMIRILNLSDEEIEIQKNETRAFLSNRKSRK